VDVQLFHVSFSSLVTSGLTSTSRVTNTTLCCAVWCCLNHSYHLQVICCASPDTLRQWHRWSHHSAPLSWFWRHLQCHDLLTYLLRSSTTISWPWRLTF